jgi:hypothetical protein
MAVAPAVKVSATVVLSDVENARVGEEVASGASLRR